ncbi:MAG TPA: hypothetical protein DEP84_04620 [Chloroflexi bacterium]|nr:hypothetical protein [Chloroflexota bacterium]
MEDMSERPLRVGVVGADQRERGFGARAHIPAVLAAPNRELRAVCTARELLSTVDFRQTVNYNGYPRRLPRVNS